MVSWGRAVGVLPGSPSRLSSCMLKLEEFVKIRHRYTSKLTRAFRETVYEYLNARSHLLELVSFIIIYYCMLIFVIESTVFKVFESLVEKTRDNCALKSIIVSSFGHLLMIFPHGKVVFSIKCTLFMIS